MTGLQQDVDETQPPTRVNRIYNRTWANVLDEKTDAAASISEVVNSGGTYTSMTSSSGHMTNKTSCSTDIYNETSAASAITEVNAAGVMHMTTELTPMIINLAVAAVGVNVAPAMLAETYGPIHVEINTPLHADLHLGLHSDVHIGTHTENHIGTHNQFGVDEVEANATKQTISDMDAALRLTTEHVMETELKLGGLITYLFGCYNIG
jgi:hypothetical protein